MNHIRTARELFLTLRESMINKLQECWMDWFWLKTYIKDMRLYDLFLIELLQTMWYATAIVIVPWTGQFIYSLNNNFYSKWKIHHTLDLKYITASLCWNNWSPVTQNLTIKSSMLWYIRYMTKYHCSCSSNTWIHWYMIFISPQIDSH